MADVLGSVFHHMGWMFLPNLGTSILQNIYYSLTIRAGRRRPQPGEPVFHQHQRRIHIFVLVLYLAYTFLQAIYDVKLDKDFYTLLQTSTSVSEKEVKRAFRAKAARFHPDKLGSDAAATTDEAFLRLRLAHDTLIAPAKRFAYDRFGSAVLVNSPSQEKLTSKSDWVYAGLRSLAPEYLKGGASLVLLNYFWFPKYGQFWRYFTVLALGLLEFTLLTHDWSPSPAILLFGSNLHGLFPNLLPPHLLPFQVLSIARRMSISINIFISQLVPQGEAQSADQQLRQNEILLNHLSQAAARVDQEASKLTNFGFSPFKGDKDMVDRLRTSMTEGIRLGTIRQNPEVKEAVGLALDRRKCNTPTLE